MKGNNKIDKTYALDVINRAYKVVYGMSMDVDTVTLHRDLDNHYETLMKYRFMRMESGDEKQSVNGVADYLLSLRK